MSAGPGSTVGPYLVERELGRGGMGVVFLGRDTRLERPVAIKALPEDLASDPGRLERFEREARSLAQVSHPNIAGIYGVEEHEGARYLVLEYVEGQTLAERLDRGPLAIDEAIDLAAQIASGVESAHEAGVIHRDLKPGNVIVTPDGRAKVLDFGLARTEESSSSSSSSSSEQPTLTSPAVHPTAAGVILGTAAYMSPEQARGRRVDRRTDVWSFGVILYEMLTGASPFVGETVSDSIGAVLHKSIDLSRLPPGVGPGLRRVLTRCVERDKDHRYRDLGDVRVELLAARHEPEAPARAAGMPRPVRFAAAAGLLGVGLAVGWLVAGALSPEPEGAVGRFDLVRETPDEQLVGASPRLSPDGRRLAFVRDGVILVRELDAFEPRALPGTEGALDIFWSPDGRWIGYLTRTAVLKAPLSGGDSIKLTGDRLSLSGTSGGAWSDGGWIYFADAEAGIKRVSDRGGEPTVVVTVDADTQFDHRDVGVLPGTETLLYVVRRRNLTFAIAVHDGEREAVLVELADSFLAYPSYSSSGHILFSRGATERSVWAVPFDADRLEVLGEPFLVEPGAWQSSVSGDGTLALVRGDLTLPGQLAWVSRDGQVESIPGDFEIIFLPLLSPDGSRIAFTAGAPPRYDVWVRDLDRGVNSRVTFEESLLAAFAWSPDGQRLAIGQMSLGGDGSASMRFLRADGTGETRDPVDGIMTSFDAQWETAVWMGDPMRQGDELFAVSVEDPSQRSGPILSGVPASRGAVSLSPDGSLLLYPSDQSGRPEIYCTRFPDGSGRWQVSTEGGENPIWAADGESLYFESDDVIYQVEVTREPSLSFGLPAAVIDAEEFGLDLGGGWAVTADGERFLATLSRAGEESTSSSIAIIQNWWREHRAR